jgi:formylglycine-generating enzyme required for sulfatase activity
MTRHAPCYLLLRVALTLLFCAAAGLGLVPRPEPAWASDDARSHIRDLSEFRYENTVTVEVSRGVKMEFVLILPGRFHMGAPPGEKGRMPNEEYREVEITKPFYLAKYPVTQEQYEALMGANPSAFSAAGNSKDNVSGLETRRHPVESVSWEDAKACCAKLNEKDPRRRPFRLPTEAEWEYACRAGTKGPFVCGEDAKQLVDHAWFCDNAKQRTHPVGQKKPNAWGLHDMQGNVWQWCEDFYGPHAGLDRKDPVQLVAVEKGNHVFRGGAWLEEPSQGMRIAWRCAGAPTQRLYYVGFRMAFAPHD